MGHMELRGSMDQHELVHTYLYACELTDWRRNELVAGYPYDLSWKHDRFDSNDLKWSCRSKIWNSLSCFRKSKLWSKRCQHSRCASCNRCVWLVWYSDMDRRFCTLSNVEALDPGPAIPSANFSSMDRIGICFFIFWLINMFIVYLGVESIRKLLIFKAIFLPVAALALLFWAINAANGLGPILEQPSKFSNSSQFFNFFFPALTGMVGFWATLSLNIPDFTRYAKSQKAQIRGQAIGLPPSMTLFAFIGVVVTSATAIVYGNTIWDPVQLAGQFQNKIVVSFAMIAVAISTLATNIAANIVSPANDFSKLWPRKINFRTGGYITGIIGVLIFPWKLIADPTGYIFQWLIAYSSLLGPVGGIMIVDYYFIKKQKLIVNELYRLQGSYSYKNGFNNAAIISLVLGILPNLPGFLLQVKVISSTAFPSWISQLYNYAWFVGFFVSGIIYLAIMRYKTSNQLIKETAYVVAD